ncbi:ABC transporter substrate-binding protein [Mycobacterium sp. IS-2888]|uniref:metal ABC transporter solute-binding protein, Zn/Mn family n=1 Tax=unclassified Mycobacterium TaxID=2642494 RepID=UPI0009701E40|nr:MULTISPECIES: zinc ABC transporter substrate-binding protein [unclassified Mycobacterium]OMC40382.1 ABC transporter substrate-binding protein [Mycobacterium sp. IS-1264]OMC49487.1 ABC transporter substrate-binding protein [Mycobacterium sp. IS-2888]
MALVNPTRRLSAIVACLAVASALAGCGIANSARPQAATVVASTDVWGSVARAVVGSHVAVKSILSGADEDPHSYQPKPSDAAAIIDAALVVYNGGGYDPWVDQVLAGHRSVKPVDAYSFVGRANPGDPPNEHVFYDLSVAKSVASAIADRMAAIDPANAADYRANAAEFCRGADSITRSEHAIASAYPHAGVIATEPVADYLLEASGLTDRTPAAFSAANENETDPAPADMASVLDLINHRRVSALLVNRQTSTSAINGVAAAARRAGVPVTEVTETLPDGTDYLTWQRNTVDQLLAALRSGR